MTKNELHKNLESGKTMDELFHYIDGQDCLIYKAETFTAGGEIIYIPDIHLNEIPMDRPTVSSEEIEAIISVCYPCLNGPARCGQVVPAEMIGGISDE